MQALSILSGFNCIDLDIGDKLFIGITEDGQTSEMGRYKEITEKLQEEDMDICECPYPLKWKRFSLYV